MGKHGRVAHATNLHRHGAFGGWGWEKDKSLLDQLLNGAELGVGGVTHQLEEGHFCGAGNYAADFHFGEAGFFVDLGAGGDAVGEEVDLIAVGEEVVGGLVYADVGFDAG